PGDARADRCCPRRLRRFRGHVHLAAGTAQTGRCLLVRRWRAACGDGLGRHGGVGAHPPHRRPPPGRGAPAAPGCGRPRGPGRRLLRVVVLVTAAGCVALAVRPGLIEGAFVMFVVGALLLTALPVVLEIAERRAGDAGGTATALLWLAGNAGGLAVALIVQVLVEEPAAAFAVMAATIMLALPLTRQGRLGRAAPAAEPAADIDQRAGSAPGGAPGPGHKGHAQPTI